MAEKVTDKKMENLRRENKELLDALAQSERREEKYREEIARFSRITSSMLDAIAELDSEGKFLYLSPSHEQIFGFKPEERIGQSAYQFIHPRDVDVVRHAIAEYIEKRGSAAIEYRCRRGDGTYCWVESVSSFVFGANGQVAGFVISTRPIEERRKAEMAIRESEKLYRNVIENIRDVFFRIDQDGIIRMISPSGARLLGYESADEMLGRNLLNEFLARPEERQKFLRALDETGFVDDYEISLKTKHGTLIRVAASCRYDYNLDAMPQGIEGTIRDISARKQVEDEIRKSEEKFRKLAEASTVGISIIDGERFVYVNPMTCQMSGYSEEEYLSRPIRDFVTPDSRNVIIQRAKDRLAGKPVPGRYEISVLTKEGSIKWAEVGATVTEYNDKPAIIFTLYDITDRKTAEAERASLQEQLNRARKREAIGALAAGIAHDFNNILSGIQGHCSLIQFQLSPNDPNYKHLQGIENQVRSGAHLTRQLLEMASGATYAMQPTDINSVIKESSDVFSRARKGIAITRSLEENLWPVEANAGQIDQVLLNLFINAAYAMNNEGDLYLESKNIVLGEGDERSFGMKPGKYVRVSVSDTGTGMDKETAQKAFQPFFTTKEKGSGTGLGLATAYSIVKNHRGYILIDSKPGIGTTFHIYFPASQEAVEKACESAKVLCRGKETILLVDDEAIIADTTKEILEMLGYRTMLAGSGQEAVAVFMEKKTSIDLVILDLVMPGMGGAKVFEALRTINSGIKIILYSGYVLNEEIQGLLDRGGCSFIQKPFGIEDLSAKIREVIDQPARA